MIELNNNGQFTGLSSNTAIIVCVFQICPLPLGGKQEENSLMNPC